MMIKSWIIAVDIILFSLFFVAVKSYAMWRRNPSGLPAPPGPQTLPIIGNLFDLPKESSWVTYKNWAKRYGSIMSVSVFGQTIIIIDSVSIAQELLEKRGAIYSDRPRIPMFEMMGISTFNFIFANYGNVWRKGRRLLNHSFQPSIVRKYRPMQMKRAREFAMKLLCTPEEHMKHARHCTTAIIMSLAYGYEVADTDDEYVNLAENLAHRTHKYLLPGAALVNILPFLKYLPGWLPGMGFKTHAQETHVLVQRFINDPFTYVKESIRKGTALPSLANDHLDVTKLSDEDESIVKRASATLYAAGADTTSTAMSSMLLGFVLYPEKQKRAQEELDRVIGRERLPCFEDFEHLPYTRALCLELIRWKVVGPLGIAHHSTEDDVYNGYFIPKGSHVLVNLWSILHDAAKYPDPEEFRPERFLDNNGRFVDDPLVASTVFGLGRRICPGRYFAEATIWIAAVSILSTLSIGVAKDEVGNELVPKEDAYTGAVISMPFPFKCSVVPRIQNAETLLRDALSDDVA